MLRKIVYSLLLFGAGGSPLLGQTQYEAVCVAFYNVENLFDTLPDPAKQDDEFLPTGSKNWTSARYQQKLTRIGEVLTRMGEKLNIDAPMLVGLCEVENLQVLEDLVKSPRLADKNYGIAHYESPDERGIDVALLYRKEWFKILATNSHYLADQDFKTRNQLVVTGQLGKDTLSVVVNHWPSRSGGQKRSEPRRMAAAQMTRQIVDSLLGRNALAKILVMGDFNDDPANKSIQEVLRANGQREKLNAPALYNPMWEMHKQGLGTLAYRDIWQIFDQIILSPALLSENRPGSYYYQAKSARVFAPDWMKQKEGSFQGYPWRTYVGNNYTNGYSDHFPVYLFLIKEK
ncbi:MAG: endonuclease/exonuclease/phosphatase family protein [Microscillaceae bacterium]|nr:endonuclease/exonuclease/phosphatase family protein [Microscillaceae bacterium]